MEQAIQIMFVTAGLAAAVGFFIAFLIFLLTLGIKIASKHTATVQQAVADTSDLELALAIAVARQQAKKDGR